MARKARPTIILPFCKGRTGSGNYFEAELTGLERLAAVALCQLRAESLILPQEAWPELAPLILLPEVWLEPLHLVQAAWRYPP